MTVYASVLLCLTLAGLLAAVARGWFSKGPKP